MESNGVLVVGSANMDLVLKVIRFPKPGETIFGEKFERFPGGKGANQAVACGKLGARTFFLGKVGEDDFGAQLLKSLNESNVDTGNVKTDGSSSSGMAMITVDDKGENEIIVISGTNMLITDADIDSSSDLFDKVDIVLTQLEIPIGVVSKVAQTARQKGKTFVLNPAPAQELPAEMFPFIDYITPNETELELLTKKPTRDLDEVKIAAEDLLGRGVKNVIVTMGEKGSILVTEKDYMHFDAYKVKPIDTTAAGDSFNGALACALSGQKSISDAIKFANASAALSVTRMGAQTSMPELNEVISLMDR